MKGIVYFYLMMVAGDHGNKSRMNEKDMIHERL
jgi:hypothetical protein